MSRVRAYLIGRHVRCDVPLDAEGVAARHAEAVLLDDGNYYITDRATPGGTFVHRESKWQPITQDFVKRGELLRLGDHEMYADELEVLRNDAGRGRGPKRGAVPKGPAGPDPDQGLMRDPQTGEIVERPRR